VVHRAAGRGRQRGGDAPPRVAQQVVVAART
jgi:hypothetical protein